MSRTDIAHKARAVFLWIAIAGLIGLICGAGAVVLSAGVMLAEHAYAACSLLGWLLPLGGLLTVGAYRALRVSWMANTGTVVEAARSGKFAPPRQAPAILVGNILTVVSGGSAGKEAAALQLGGGLASLVGIVLTGRFRLVRLLDHDHKDCEGTFVMCGMAAGFSALMFAPLAASVFVLEVTRSHASLSRLVAVFVSACTGYAVAAPLGIDYPWHLLAPESSFTLEIGPCLAAIVAGALLGALFCLTLRGMRAISWLREVPAWAEVLVGGILIAVLVHLLGLTNFSGTGYEQIVDALGGECGTWDFACKFLFTAITLGLGFKGGELMPALCVGACAGCTIGTLLGADTATCAACGLIAVLSAVTNCPLAAFILGFEAFGVESVPYSAIASLLGFALTFPVSLYASNIISKPSEFMRAMSETYGGLRHWK